MKTQEKIRHTPGPWRTENVKDDNVGIIALDIYSPSCTDGIIATIPLHSEFTDLEAVANARLIAAAPETAAERDRLKEINKDLLAALKKLVHVTGPHDGNGEELENAYAAIAKAEGR